MQTALLFVAVGCAAFSLFALFIAVHYARKRDRLRRLVEQIDRSQDWRHNY